MSEKPFKDWEEVKRQIHKCGRWGDICVILAFLFVIIGVIGEALKIDLRLAPTSWLLLAVFFAVFMLAPQIHIAAMKTWYGVESERKNK